MIGSLPTLLASPAGSEKWYQGYILRGYVVILVLVSYLLNLTVSGAPLLNTNQLSDRLVFAPALVCCVLRMFTCIHTCNHQMELYYLYLHADSHLIIFFLKGLTL